MARSRLQLSLVDTPPRLEYNEGRRGHTDHGPSLSTERSVR